MSKYPKDWEEVKLEDVFTITRGQVLATEKIKKDKSSAFKYPVYSSQTLNKGLLGYYNKYLFQNAITWTTDGANAGDTNFRKGKFYCTNVCGVLLNDGGYSNYCIAAIINSVSRNYVSYVGNPKLMNNVVGKIKITIPTLQEQKAIADTLMTFDDHIENLEKLIEKKKMIRDGALEDLMTGKTRLDGFEGEWEEVKIGDILKILYGKNQQLVESSIGKYPILGTGGIIGKSNDYLCDWACVCIGRKGTIDKPIYVDYPFWSIDTLYYSKPLNGNDAKFQYYLFKTINWLDYAESSGRPSLSKNEIESIEIKTPTDIKEQKAIAEILTSMDEEIENLRQEKAKIEKIKQGAMDDLLTGRVRLVQEVDYEGR